MKQVLLNPVQSFTVKLKALLLCYLFLLLSYRLCFLVAHVEIYPVILFETCPPILARSWKRSLFNFFLKVIFQVILTTAVKGIFLN